MTSLSPNNEEELGPATKRLIDQLHRMQMFDPPLPGSLIAGVPICSVPDSDIKYGSFLEWWFAVGRKAPDITQDGWASVSGPFATKGYKNAIPGEEWERLPPSERDAISRWVCRIETCMLTRTASALLGVFAPSTPPACAAEAEP